MTEAEIKQFIDDYCEVCQKHKIQFAFDDQISIEPLEVDLVIGQTYPNEKLAHLVRELMGF